MRRFLLPCIALIVAAASPVTDRAGELFDRGEEKAAFELVEAAAPADVDALDALASFYDAGRHVAHDPARAASLYRQAAERGQPHAQWRLGVMLDVGEGVAEDPVEALLWLRRSAGQNYGRGHVALADMYANGRGADVDLEAAMRHYRRGAELGDSGGFLGVGWLHASGQGAAADRIEAAGWYLAALTFEDERAQQAIDTLDLDAAEMEQAIARANAILEQLGFSGRLRYRGVARRT